MASGRGGIGTRTILRTFVRLTLFLGLGFAAGLFFGVVTEEPGLLAGHLQGETQRYVLGSDAEEANEPNDAGSRIEADRAPVSAPPATGTDAGRERAILAERAGAGDADDSSAGPLATARRIEAERATEANRESALPDVAARPKAAPAAPLIPTRPPAPPPVPASADRAGAGSLGEAESWAIQVGAFSDRSAAAGLVQSLRDKRYPVELIPSQDGSDRWRVRVQPIEGRGEAERWAFRLKRDERLPTWLIPFEAREAR